MLVAKGGTFLIFGVCPAEAAVLADLHEIRERVTRAISSKMPPHNLHWALQMSSPA